MNASLSDLPHLSRLLDTYLHQDWRLFGPTLEAVVQAYIEDGPASDTRGLHADITRLLAARHADLGADLRRAYPDMVRPEGWNITAEAWLQRIADQTLQGAHG